MKTAMLALSALLVASVALAPGVAASPLDDVRFDSSIIPASPYCVSVYPFSYTVAGITVSNDSVRYVCVKPLASS